VKIQNKPNHDSKSFIQPALCRLSSIKAQPNKTDKNIFEFRGVWIATVENIDYPSKKRI
jgi:hypothetical protein